MSLILSSSKYTTYIYTENKKKSTYLFRSIRSTKIDFQKIKMDMKFTAPNGGQRDPDDSSPSSLSTASEFRPLIFVAVSDPMSGVEIFSLNDRDRDPPCVFARHSRVSGGFRGSQHWRHVILQPSSASRTVTSPDVVHDEAKDGWRARNLETMPPVLVQLDCSRHSLKNID